MNEVSAMPKPYRDIQGFVRATILKLYRANAAPGSRGIDHPKVRESLARIRAAVNVAPGTSPDIWGMLPSDPAECIADDLGSWAKRDAASPQEIAIHHALVLWAMHQRSQSEPMHDVPGEETGTKRSRTFAQAVGILSKRRDKSVEEGKIGPTQRRFVAALRANSIASMVRHLQGIIPMLREEGIAFDYGTLARDLLRFQIPGWRAGVLRDWSKDFYTVPNVEASQEESAATTSEN